jgi:predicted NBD/HSP70 family sugar kinase
VEHEARRSNRAAVLAEILASTPTTRTAIAHATNLSGATVSRMVEGLLNEGIARESDTVFSGRRGRRATQVEAVAERTVACGVDLGASNTRVVISDLLARPLVQRRVPTPTGLETAELADWLAQTILAAAGELWPKVGSMALGLPGAVRQEDRAVSNAPNLVQVEDPHFLVVLESRLGHAVEVDNDSNYALLGEQRFGAARSAPTAVMLTIGAGLGAGVAIDGRIFRGRNGLVGEFGHLPVGPLGTPLEHMVTGPGIMRRAAELGLDLSSPAALFREDADAPVVAMRLHVEQALLIVLTAAVVSYEPDIIVIGGGIAQSLAPSIDRLGTAVGQILRSAPPVVAAQLDDLSGALGAAVAALHRIYRELGVAEEDLTRIPNPGVPDSSSAAAPPLPTELAAQ